MNLLDLAEGEQPYVYHIDHRRFGEPRTMGRSDADKLNAELERSRLRARWMPLAEFSRGFLGQGYQVVL